MILTPSQAEGDEKIEGLPSFSDNEQEVIRIDVELDELTVASTFQKLLLLTEDDDNDHLTTAVPGEVFKIVETRNDDTLEGKSCNVSKTTVELPTYRARDASLLLSQLERLID